MSGVPTAPKLRLTAMVRQSFTAMTPAERRRVTLMYASIFGLHLLGFGVFIAFVIPAHYRGLGIGVAARSSGLSGPRGGAALPASLTGIHLFPRRLGWGLVSQGTSPPRNDSQE